MAVGARGVRGDDGVSGRKSIDEAKAEIREREIAYYRAHPDEPMPVVIRVRERGGIVRWPERLECKRNDDEGE